MVENKENNQYIETYINPILEEIVTSMIMSKPSDPQVFMLEFLLKKSGQMEEFQNQAKQELHRLRQTLSSLKGQVVHDEEEGANSESEEEEDDLIELPQAPVVKKGHRSSVSAEAFGAYNVAQKFKPKVYPKNQEQRARIVDKLNKAFMFSALEPDELDVVIDAMQEKVVQAGEVVIQQGEDGNELYVVDQGKLECTKQFPRETVPKKLKEYYPGDAFGELALLYNTPRAATITALCESVLWVLDRVTFNHIVKGAASKKREKYEKFMAQSSLFKEMDPYERSKIGDAFKSVQFQPKETIVREGDWGDIFYMIEEGNAYATKTLEPGKPPQKVKEYAPGDYFGELALLRGEPRAANIIASVRFNIDESEMCNFRQTQLQEAFRSFRRNTQAQL